MQAFYSGLFGLEITVFGIIAASILVILQLLSTNFSYGHLRVLFKNYLLWLYVFTTAITLFITGVGSVKLLFSEYDFIPCLNFNCVLLLQAPWVVMSMFLFFFLSVGSGFLLIAFSVRVLNPSRLLTLHEKALKATIIQQFLFRKYGIPIPSKEAYRFELSHQEQMYETLQELGVPGEPMLSGEQQLALQKKQAEAKIVYQQSLLQYQQLKNEVVGTEVEILEELQVIMNKAILNSDIATIRHGSQLFIQITQKCLPPYPDGNDSPGIWDPYLVLPEHWGTHMKEWLDTQLEMCEKENSLSLAHYFIHATFQIVLFLIETQRGKGVKSILVSWKQWADHALTQNSRSLLTELVNAYKAILEDCFKHGEPKQKGVTDAMNDIFRHLGWLAERLLVSKGLESKPNMHDRDYLNEYDILVNTILNLGASYEREFPTGYPLIYFDAVICVFDKLLDIHQTNAQRNPSANKPIEQELATCCDIFSSFAKIAMQHANGNGACLAALKLNEVYGQARKKQLNELAQQILSEIVEVAIEAAGVPEHAQKSRQILSSVQDILIETIIECPVSYWSTVQKTINYTCSDTNDNVGPKRTFVKSLISSRQEYFKNLRNSMDNESA